MTECPIHGQSGVLSYLDEEGKAALSGSPIARDLCLTTASFLWVFSDGITAVGVGFRDEAWSIETCRMRSSAFRLFIDSFISCTKV